VVKNEDINPIAVAGVFQHFNRGRLTVEPFQKEIQTKGSSKGQTSFPPIEKTKGRKETKAGTYCAGRVQISGCSMDGELRGIGSGLGLLHTGRRLDLVCQREIPSANRGVQAL